MRLLYSVALNAGKSRNQVMVLFLLVKERKRYTIMAQSLRMPPAVNPETYRGRSSSHRVQYSHTLGFNILTKT